MRPLKKRKRKAKRTRKPCKYKEKGYTDTDSESTLRMNPDPRLGENDEKREERELDREGLLRDLEGPSRGEGKWNGLRPGEAGVRLTEAG